MSLASPARRAIDTAEVALGGAVLVVWIVSVSGLLLAETGHFSASALLAVSGALSLPVLVAAWLAVPLGTGARARTPARDWLTLGVVVATAAWLFQPPAEAVIDGGDASVYLAVGELVAREGALTYADPVVEALPADLRDDLFSRGRIPPVRHDFFPGGVQLGPDGRVEPGFFHLLPVWIASFTVVFGPAAAGWPNVLFGVLAVALAWALARRLASPLGGAVAAALLVANFAQVWFGRFPTAEVATEAFVLASLLGLVIAADGGPIIAAVLAGLAVGLTGLVRIDGLLLVAAPLLAVGAYRWLEHRDDRRRWTWFLAAASCSTAYAAFHAWAFAGAYTERALRIAGLSRWSPDAGLSWMAGLAALVALLAAVLVRIGRNGLRVGLLTGAAAMAAWLVLTSRVSGAGPLLVAVGSGSAALAAVGLVVLLVSRRAAAAWPIVLVFLLSAVVYVQSPRDVGGMPMVLRRFVPVVLPIALVAVGVAVSWIARLPRGRVVAVSIGLALVALSARQLAPLVVDPPLQGVRAAVAGVAATLPAGAVAIVDPPAPSHLGLALRYHVGRLTLVPSGPRSPGSLARAVRTFLDEGRAVRLIVAPGAVADTRLRREEIGLADVRPVGPAALEYRALAASGDLLPDALVPVRHALEVYEVTAPLDGGTAVPLVIDLGAMDFGWVGSGLHAPESIAGAGVRWTDGEAVVVVPALALAAGTALTISTRLQGARPDGRHPTVELVFDGEAVGAFQAADDMAEYRATLSPDVSRRLATGGTLALRSQTFVPADFGATDARRLGVLLDWLRIEPVDR